MSAFFAGKSDGLAAAQSGGLVDSLVRDPSALEVFLGPRYEERGGCLERIQTSKINVSTVHDIERAAFEDQKVESIDIVHFSFGNEDKARNVAAQIDQRVECDGCLAFAKLGSWKELQTEIDCGRIECVNSFLEIDRQSFARIERAGVGNEAGGKIEIDTPVSDLICLGQGIASNRTPDADMIQFRLVRVQACFDFTQAGSEGQLRKSHA
jgi:hypothetical protein